MRMNKNMILLTLVSLLVMLVLSSAALTAEEYEPTWASLDRRPMPAWFLDAKFGIFIVWAGRDAFGSFRLPDPRYFVIGIAVVAVLAAIALATLGTGAATMTVMNEDGVMQATHD